MDIYAHIDARDNKVFQFSVGDMPPINISSDQFHQYVKQHQEKIESITISASVGTYTSHSVTTTDIGSFSGVLVDFRHMVEDKIKGR